MCVAKCDGVVHILPQTPHSCCPLFLFAAFFVAVVISFRIISSCISTSPTTSSTSGGGIFKHNTFGSSFSSFKTVLAFSALFGCGFFLRPPIITFSIIFRRVNDKRVFMRETKNEGISRNFLQLSVLEKELSLLRSQICETNSIIIQRHSRDRFR